MAKTAQDGKKRHGLFRRLFRFAIRVAIIAVLAIAVLVPLYAVVNPPVSALMLWRLAGGQTFTYDWVPLDEIDKDLPLAVITSEDNRFCQHAGVDWQAVRQAMSENRGSGPRGASTISMQVVKNLFLWPSRSYVRKGLEVPLALYADLVWSKRRMIEIYLNIAEWGPGIYGVGAAAQAHFGTTPDKLTRRQAAQLAASLPNPFERIAGKPGPQTRRISRIIGQRMGRNSNLVGCLSG